ncbi:MAG: hypothetical protein L3K23_10300 [Thermoplasmata archaeon]|nr:hypothetical protein [Thermoplasmata archaeon]
MSWAPARHALGEKRSSSRAVLPRSASVYDPSSGSTPNPPVQARYPYLVSRLRNRQITIEEATELFALQQVLIAQATAASRAPPPAPEPAQAPPPPPPPTTLGPGVFSDDNIALGLLAMGVGTGLLAAVMKRAQAGPNPTR